jgi:hypothetical protein
MGAIVDAIKAMMVDHQDPYLVYSDLEDFRVQPQRISLDYYPAEAIRMNMLHLRGTGHGRQRNTTIHAVCERDMALGRSRRKAGDLVCGKKIKAFAQGDINSSPPGEPVTCPECRERIDRHSLAESIRHKFGAWER